MFPGIIRNNIANTPIKITDDVQIITVLNTSLRYNNPLANIQKIDGRPIEFITYEVYHKWSTKLIGIVDYIQSNYDNLPNYIMYVDALDVLLLKDLLDPQEMLNYYGCKMLFNHEGNFSHTGWPPPENTVDYWGEVYKTTLPKYIDLNTQKYGVGHQCALNAGVFLGEKAFVLKVIKEALDTMNDDPQKGYPYGCPDDQVLLRHFHVKYYEDISIDLFNRYFLWSPPGGIIPDEENIFCLGYGRRYLESYENIRAQK